MHVGLIPDGARRYGRANGLGIQDAYDVAMDKIADFVDVYVGLGARSVTVYLLSSANLRRPKTDLLAAAMAEAKLLDGQLKDLASRHQLRVRVVGSAESAPEPLRSAAHRVRGIDGGAFRGTVNLLIAYDALEEVGAAPQPLTRISDLALGEPLDLVIRTSGERRLSGFPPLQSAYAELVFLESSICEVTRSDWRAAYQEYLGRDRRLGL